MFLTMQTGIPAGTYQARLTGVEESSGEFGDSLLWSFEIATGPYKGQKVSRYTGANPAPGNAAGHFFEAITGGTVGVDTRKFNGCHYTVQVAPTKTGKVRVEAVLASLGVKVTAEQSEVVADDEFLNELKRLKS